MDRRCALVTGRHMDTWGWSAILPCRHSCLFTASAVLKLLIWVLRQMLSGGTCSLSHCVCSVVLLVVNLGTRSSAPCLYCQCNWCTSLLTPPTAYCSSTCEVCHAHSLLQSHSQCLGYHLVHGSRRRTSLFAASDQKDKDKEDKPSGLAQLSGTWRLVYSSAFSSGSIGGRKPGPPASLLPARLGQVCI